MAVLHGTLGGRPGALLGLDAAQADGLGQPALTTYVAAGLAVLVSPFERLSQALAPAAEGVDVGSRVFFDLFAVLAGLALVVAVVAVVRLSGRRPWDATLLAASPVVVLSGLVSFDVLGVALGVVASRCGPAATRWWRGCCSARPSRPGSTWSSCCSPCSCCPCGPGRSGRWPWPARPRGSCGPWSTCRSPCWRRRPGPPPRAGWWAAEPGYGSLLQLPRLMADEQVPGMAALSARQGTVASLVLTLAVLVAVTVWVLACPRPPRLPVVVLVLLVGTLLASKAVPVQASVWLLPWAALAVPSWRDHLWWWAAEALYVVGVWQFLVSLTESSRALPAGFFAALLAGRLAAIGWLGVQAWRLSWRPGSDPVRRDADGEDPAAGPLRGESDRFVLEFT